MAVTHYGADGTDLIPLRGYPKKKTTGEGVERSYAYRMKIGQTLIPTIGTADPLGGGLKLDEVLESAVRGGTMVDLEFVYREVDNDDGNPPPAGTKIYEGDSAANARPIEEHPNFVGFADDDPTRPLIATAAVPGGFEKTGVRGYLDPQPVARRTEYVTPFSWTEANIISGVGTIEDPPFVTAIAVPAKHWLKTVRQVRQRGSVFEVVEEWQYTKDKEAAGWDADIY